MKVLAINGSPRKEGNTYHALKLVTNILEQENIETEILHIGKKEIRGCTACNRCLAKKNEQCVLPGDEVNLWIQKMKGANGILLGTPVHYSAISATMKSFLDRAFYVAGANHGMFRHKVGASVVAVRRSGGVTTFDQLNNFLLYSEMIIPASNYWNVIHGTVPGEALKDEEGIQIMQVLGKNMAWLLKMIEYSKGIISPPEREKKIYTNFIR